MKKLSKIFILAIMLTVLVVPSASAGEVGIQALITQSVTYYNSSHNQISSCSLYDWIYVRGEQQYISTVLADGKFEMCLHPDLDFFDVTTTNMNITSADFDYEYVSAYGDYCYHYASNVFWYFPAMNKYVELEAMAGAKGTKKSMVGTDYLTGDPWATAYLSVN